MAQALLQTTEVKKVPVLVEKKPLGNEKGNQQDQNLFMCNEVIKKIQK